MATEILRPNGAGYETGLTRVGGSANWDAVSDQNDATFALQSISSYARDLYALPSPVVDYGPINSVTVYIRAKETASDLCNGRVSYRQGTTTTDGDINDLTTSYTDIPLVLTTNPATGLAWQWADLATGQLQIGVSLKGVSGGASAYCAECWLSIDYDEIPNAPTSVTATEGTSDDTVTLGWVRSTGATGYRVYRDSVNISGLLGDVDTWDDDDADIPVITGAATATRGKYKTLIKLATDGAVAPVVHEYYVTAIGPDGESDPSETVEGWKGLGNIEFQWQKSAGDSDADYSNITWGTLAEYTDADVPVYPAGRYYRCVLNARNADELTTPAVRGNTGSPRAEDNRVDLVLKTPAGDTIAYIPNASAVSTDYQTNALPVLEFRIPSDFAYRDQLAFPNRVWRYENGVLMDTYVLADVRGIR